jgi:hypothetical protein
LENFIRDAAFIMADEIGKRPEFLQLFFIELNEFRGKHAPLLMQVIHPQFLPLLQRIKDSQRQLRDLPPQVMVLSFAWIFFAHYLAESAIDPEGSLFTEPGNLDQYLDVFLHGILISSKPEIEME